MTLCAWQRDCLFGEVVGGEVRLSLLGQIVHDEWLRSGGIRREIHLYEDEFVIMPNHLHGVVWIVDIVGAEGALDVGADGIRPGGKTPGEGERRSPLQQMAPRSLSSFITGFKSSVTSRAKRELNMNGIWQRNYYDHIIRNETELKKIWDYMDTNPDKWTADQLHPVAPPNRFNQDKQPG